MRVGAAYRAGMRGAGGVACVAVAAARCSELLLLPPPSLCSPLPARLAASHMRQAHVQLRLHCRTRGVKRAIISALCRAVDQLAQQRGIRNVLQAGAWGAWGEGGEGHVADVQASLAAGNRKSKAFPSVRAGWKRSRGRSTAERELQPQFAPLRAVPCAPLGDASAGPAVLPS